MSINLFANFFHIGTKNKQFTNSKKRNISLSYFWLHLHYHFQEL